MVKTPIKNKLSFLEDPNKERIFTLIGLLLNSLTIIASLIGDSLSKGILLCIIAPFCIFTFIMLIVAFNPSKNEFLSLTVTMEFFFEPESSIKELLKNTLRIPSIEIQGEKIVVFNGKINFDIFEQSNTLGCADGKTSNIRVDEVINVIYKFITELRKKAQDNQEKISFIVQVKIELETEFPLIDPPASHIDLEPIGEINITKLPKKLIIKFEQTSKEDFDTVSWKELKKRIGI